MFKLEVKDLNGNILHAPKFTTLEEAEAQKADILAFNGWNFPSHESVLHEWQETIPATDTTPEYVIIHPMTITKVCDFTVEITDITVQVLAEQFHVQAVKDAQTQAGLRLQAFPAQVDACQDLDALKVAIKQMVSDVAVLLQ